MTPTTTRITTPTPTTAPTPLARKVLAEFVGTAFLVATVVGSGIAADRLNPGQPGAALLANALATGAVLAALILALRHVSGAHFNPVVTLIDRITGTDRGTTKQALAYVAAQVAGGCLGAAVANEMFDAGLVRLSTHHRGGVHLLLAEVVATLGLLLVIFGLARAGHHDATPYAVGGYLVGAYFFTSSTSFANPAVTIARMLSNTFSGIAPASVAAFIAAQLVGMGLALALLRGLYPKEQRS